MSVWQAVEPFATEIPQMKWTGEIKWERGIKILYMAPNSRKHVKSLPHSWLVKGPMLAQFYIQIIQTREHWQTLNEVVN